jgi:hypothetical protein
MTTTSLPWHPGQETIDANIAATLEMNRAAWESAGATFVEVDDGDGDRPGLAVGGVDVDGRHVDFGVLDYAAPTTYLLVGGPDDTRPALTARVIDELLAAHIVPRPEVVLEILGLAEPASPDDKVEYLAALLDTRLDEFAQRIQAQVSAALQSRPLPPAFTEAPGPLFVGVGDLVTVHDAARVGTPPTHVSLRGSARDLHLLASVPPRSITGRPIFFNELRGEAVLLIDHPEGGPAIQLVLAGLASPDAIGDQLSVTIPYSVLQTYHPRAIVDPSTGPTEGQLPLTSDRATRAVRSVANLLIHLSLYR